MPNTKWIHQRYTCVPHPEPSSLLIASLWVVPVHQPQASSIVLRTWTGDSFHIWYYTCFNDHIFQMAILHCSAILILPCLIAFTTFPEHYCISVPLYLLGYGLTSYFPHLFSLKSNMLPASILPFLISHTFQQQITLIISGQSNHLEVLWILLSLTSPYWCV